MYSLDPGSFVLYAIYVDEEVYTILYFGPIFFFLLLLLLLLLIIPRLRFLSVVCCFDIVVKNFDLAPRYVDG